MAPETKIGTVSSLTGQATALSVDGEVRTLAADAAVFQDDTITTRGGSSVELRFEDGTVFSQGADSEVLLDVYVYNAEAGSGELLFNLAKGSLRAVSGEIAKLNPEGFNVQTPLSTVGIRGTGFFVLLSPEGQIVGVEQMDPTHVVVVETELGQVTIARQGEFVAVQLDGFLSDPALFTPEFLQGVQDMIPMHSDPPNQGDQGQGDDQGDGQDGQEGDIPQEVLDDLTDALQALQALGDSDALQGVLGALQGVGDGGDQGDGNGVTDTLAELYDLLGSLQDTLNGLMDQAGNLADDILFGNSALEDLLHSNFDFSQITDHDTNGSAYVQQFQSAGYDVHEGDANPETLDYPSSTGKTAIFGYGGNDTITGGVNNDAIFGGSGLDTLKGGTGNDYIYGGTDADEIHGQVGADYLVGGGGEDKFYYNNLLEGGDTIADFVAGGTVGCDKIYLYDNALAFNFLGNVVMETVAGFATGEVGTNNYVTLVMDTTNHKLYYDTDATNGITGATLIATFENGATPTLGDIQLFT